MREIEIELAQGQLDFIESYSELKHEQTLNECKLILNEMSIDNEDITFIDKLKYLFNKFWNMIKDALQKLLVYYKNFKSKNSDKIVLVKDYYLTDASRDAKRIADLVRNIFSIWQNIKEFINGGFSGFDKTKAKIEEEIREIKLRFIAGDSAQMTEHKVSEYSGSMSSLIGEFESTISYIVQTGNEASVYLAKKIEGTLSPSTRKQLHETMLLANDAINFATKLVVKSRYEIAKFQ